MTETPKALIIRCSDPRFQPAFEDFIGNFLGFRKGEYAPLTIPGCTSSLGEKVDTFLPKNYKIVKEQVETVLENYHDRKPTIILINHADCKGYASILGKLQKYMKIINIGEKQVDDVKFAMEVIKKIAQRYAPQSEFELYFAKIQPDQEIVFEDILSGNVVWPKKTETAAKQEAHEREALRQ